MRYHDISWHIMAYHNISWNDITYYGISWDIMTYHEITWFDYLWSVPLPCGQFMAIFKELYPTEHHQKHLTYGSLRKSFTIQANEIPEEFRWVSTPRLDTWSLCNRNKVKSANSSLLFFFTNRPSDWFVNFLHNSDSSSSPQKTRPTFFRYNEKVRIMYFLSGKAKRGHILVPVVKGMN